MGTMTVTEKRDTGPDAVSQLPHRQPEERIEQFDVIAAHPQGRRVEITGKSDIRLKP